MALPAAGRTWKLIKFLARETAYAIPSGVSYLEEQLDQNEPASPLEWMRWHCIWQRGTPAGTSEDRAQFKMDLLNITGGAVDSSWTAGDFATVKGAFDTYLAIIASGMSTDNTFIQYRAYQMSFNPADPGPGHRSKAEGYAYNKTGPPRYVADISIPGVATSQSQAYQLATGVTLRTGLPKHWGRMYLPPPTPTDVTQYGRIGTSRRTALANGALALGKTLSDADFLPVIPCTDMDRHTFHGLMGVTQYVVDDIPDVQRRRRARQALTRTVGV